VSWRSPTRLYIHTHRFSKQQASSARGHHCSNKHPPAPLKKHTHAKSTTLRKVTPHASTHPALAVVRDEVELVSGLKGKAQFEEEGVIQRRENAALGEGVSDLLVEGLGWWSDGGLGG
jgi:hypothetical protein